MFAIVILSAWSVLADVRHAAFSVFAAVLSGGIGDAVVNCLLRVAILSRPLPIEAPVIPVANEARSPQEIENARNKCGYGRWTHSRVGATNRSAGQRQRASPAAHRAIVS